MRWISVKDRVPEMDKEVLIFGDLYDEKNIIRSGRFTDYCNGGETYWISSDSDDRGDLFESVSHWMPLPPAPKKRINYARE